MKRNLPDLSALALPEAEFAVRVHPGARRNTLIPGDPIRIEVTAAPEAGRANAAVRDMLARALGVAPSRLRLVRGAVARDKRYQLEGSAAPAERRRR